MLKLQIVSDLHIEYKNNTVPDPLDLITPEADILVLAGDIGSLYKFDQLRNFMVKLCEYFQLVLYVPGNHEYYKIPENEEKISINNLLDRLEYLSNSITNL